MMTAEAHAIACMEVWGGNRAFTGEVSVPGHDVHVSCVPHVGDDDGGDIYYVSNCAAGLITRFILADVSGHGRTVAKVASDLRSIMRRHINTADQTRFAIALNQSFADLPLNGRFATAILLTYFAPTDHIIICNAGHPRPLLYLAAERRWSLLDVNAPGVLADPSTAARDSIGISNLPLGILSPTDYRQFALRLSRGDRIVLYSDALIESADRRGRQLGECGLLELASSIDPNESHDVGEAILARIASSISADSLDDDATVITLHHTASDPPVPTLTERITRFANMLGIGTHALNTGPGSPVP